jgi:hypothetical protein
MKVTWLDRTLIIGPYLCLCKTEEELIAAYKHCTMSYPLDDDLQFPPPGGASTIQLENPDGELVVIVTIGDRTGYSKEETSAILVHEATHVIEAFFDHIREKTPSSEFRAYCMQAVVEKLLEDYKRKRR